MSVFASSSFTVPSDIGLASYTPEVGGAFVAHPHVNYSPAFVVVGASDQIFATGTSAYYVDTAPPSADYYAEADFKHVTTVSQNIAICLRMDTTADTMLIVRFNGGTIFEMRTIVAGAANTIGSSSSDVPPAGSFTRGRFVAVGDQLSFYVYIAGVLQTTPIIGPITSALVMGAGRAGVRNAGASSATTGMHLDNFEAGTLDLAQPSFEVRLNRPAMFLPGIPR